MGTQWGRCEFCCQNAEGTLFREETPPGNEFHRADTANITAAEDEMGDVSFGSLILFQRAHDSMLPATPQTPALNESNEKEELQRLNELLALVRKEQEMLESDILTEQSKLQEEREEMEREKRTVEALLRQKEQPEVLWSERYTSQSSARSRSGREGGSSMPSKGKILRRTASSPHPPKR